MNPQSGQINYIEIPTTNISASKEFFTQLFGWNFVDYGPDYCAFSDAGINGGFFKSELTVSTTKGAPLIVLYSTNLAQSLSEIEHAGGTISKPIFAFPGGRRFHFLDPSENEYAVWSDQ